MDTTAHSILKQKIIYKTHQNLWMTDYSEIKFLPTYFSYYLAKTTVLLIMTVSAKNIMQKTELSDKRSYLRMTSNHSSYIYTYIICHCNPSIRIIDLVSHTTYVVCVNFIHMWRDLQFKVHSERQIFWETFHDNFYLLSEFLPEIC